MTALHRSVLRLSPSMRDRLDELAGLASTALRREVPRSAVLRAAIGAWLEANEHADPAQLVEEIRTALISRGRKRRSGCSSPRSRPLNPRAAARPAA